MKAHVIGVSFMSFKGNDGRDVSGQSVYYTYQDSNVNGLACDRIFISSRHDCVLTPESDIEMQFNRRGRLISVSEVD